MLNQSSLSPQQPVKEIFKMTQEELNQILALPDIALIWDQFVFDRVYMKKADVSVENLTRPRYLLLVGGGSEIVSPKEEYYIKIRMLFLNQYYPRIYQLLIHSLIRFIHPGAVFTTTWNRQNI